MFTTFRMPPKRPRPISPIEDAIADIKAGKMVILMDDENRENEGDLCMAAEKVTPEAINFMAKLRPRPDLPGAHRRAHPDARA